MGKRKLRSERSEGSLGDVPLSFLSVTGPGRRDHRNGTTYKKCQDVRLLFPGSFLFQGAPEERLNTDVPPPPPPCDTEERKGGP